MSQEPRNNTAVLETVREAIEHAAAGKVFGAPVEHDGITVLPVAKVSGGGRRRRQPDRPRAATTPAAPVAGSACPRSRLVCSSSRTAAVTWRPALDVNK